MISIVISIVVALFLLAVVLVFQYNQFFFYKGANQSVLIHNYNSTLQVIQANAKQFDFGTHRIDLFGNQTDSVQIERKQWGLLDLWGIEVWKHQQRMSKRFVAAQQQRKDSLAIYLSGSNGGLSLCGKTVIKGDAVLPNQGVKRAYIEGKNFNGSRLIQGRVAKNERQKVFVSAPLKKRMGKWMRLGGATLETIPVGSLTRLFNSQGSIDSIPIYRSNSQVHLSGTSTLKWSIVVSSTEIVVGGSSAEYCIFIAPKITVRSGFVGNIQCFASESIHLQKDVELSYPSNVVLLSSGKNDEIVLDEGSKIDGAVLIATVAPKTVQNWPKLKVHPTSEIWGSAVIEGKTELQGTIVGTIETKLFTLKTPSSSYENHLLDATIDRLSLPKAHATTYFSNQEQATELLECIK